MSANFMHHHHMGHIGVFIYYLANEIDMECVGDQIRQMI